MGEFEEILADMGVNQWVRNKFVAKLRTFKDSGKKDVDLFIQEFNEELLADFKVIVNEEVERVIKQAAGLMEAAPTTTI